MTTKKVVCISGGFDPVHIGHLRMIEEAAKYGDVVAIVNSDGWLMRKKGYIFMPFEERCEIIEGFTHIASTTYVDDNDGTVCEALRRIKPDFFANGGDRQIDNTPEMQVCEEEGITLLWNVGGDKIQSSTELVVSSGAVGNLETEIDGVDIRPSRVEILTAGDIMKKSNY